MPRRPMEGIRIIDTGVVWASALETRWAAVAGAEVIHVEAHRRVDPVRLGDHPDNDPKGKWWETGGRYHFIHSNKRSLALDTTVPKGKEIFKELVKVSDVVSENFAPRVMKNLGLDYPALRAVNPDIIMVSISGFGHSGPWVNRKAYAVNSEVESGLTWLTGQPGGSPVKTRAAYLDVVTAMHGVFALAAALEYRRRTGKGQWIDLCQYELGVRITGQAVMDYTMNRNIPMRTGNHHALMAPHGCYRCQGTDRWIAIAVTSDGDWRKLRQVMGDPEWARGERFDTASSRKAHESELDERIEEWTITVDGHQAMKALQEAGVAAGVVLSPRDVYLDPQLKERGFFHAVDYPALEGMEHIGRRLHLGNPWRFLGTQPERIEPAPTLGRDNRYVLIDILGKSEDEVAELYGEGVIGQDPPAQIAGGFWETVPLPAQKEQGQIVDYDIDYKKRLGLE